MKKVKRVLEGMDKKENVTVVEEEETIETKANNEKKSQYSIII